MSALLQVGDLELRQGGRLLCADLQLTVEAGQRWLVLGENGSGKSTLLAALAGWLACPGRIALAGRALGEWPARERARQLAWLSQHDDCPFPLSVRDKALTGRHPHLGRWDWESAADVALAEAQLARLDLLELAGRDLATLSGGERRRASLAAALTQQAALLLLDEPLSQLDLRHQQQALNVLAEEAAHGRAIVMVSHDPNHAIDFASHVLLLYGDGRWQAGPLADVLNEANLSALYRHPVQRGQIGGQPCFLPQRRPWA